MSLIGVAWQMHVIFLHRSTDLPWQKCTHHMRFEILVQRHGTPTRSRSVFIHHSGADCRMRIHVIVSSLSTSPATARATPVFVHIPFLQTVRSSDMDVMELGLLECTVRIYPYQKSVRYSDHCLNKILLRSFWHIHTMTHTSGQQDEHNNYDDVG